MCAGSRAATVGAATDALEQSRRHDRRRERATAPDAAAAGDRVDRMTSGARTTAARWPAVRRRITSVTATGILSVGGPALGPVAAAEADGALNGRISFTSFRDGQLGDIWTMNPDGTQLRKLTAGALYDAQSDWSPDGQWITGVPPRPERLAATRGLEDGPLRRSAAAVARETGGSTQNATQPAWMPDGRGLCSVRPCLVSCPTAVRVSLTSLSALRDEPDPASGQAPDVAIPPVVAPGPSSCCRAGLRQVVWVGAPVTWSAPVAARRPRSWRGRSPTRGSRGRSSACQGFSRPVRSTRSSPSCCRRTRSVARSRTEPLAEARGGVDHQVAERELLQGLRAAAGADAARGAGAGWVIPSILAFELAGARQRCSHRAIDLATESGLCLVWAPREEIVVELVAAADHKRRARGSRRPPGRYLRRPRSGARGGDRLRRAGP